MNGGWIALLFWLSIALVLLAQLLPRRLSRVRRDGTLQRLARVRGAQVLPLISHWETQRILGVPVARQFVPADPEAVLRAIALTPANVALDVILHAPGDDTLASEQIAHALVRHPGRVTVFVPYHALGSAVLIALAADEIALDPNAVLGPLNPQVGPYPASALLALAQEKPVAALADQTVIMIDQARRVRAQAQAIVTELLVARGNAPEQAAEVAALLTGGGWSAHYPIMVEEAERLGLPVTTKLPRELYALLDLYDTGSRARPSATIVPLRDAHDARDEAR